MRGGKDLKTIRKKLAALALTGILVATLGNGILVSAENQGTNGTEMQVMEAEQLEVQLGKEWAGREFQLKTDAGLYPGTITVGGDGVLRTELGGSRRYILTCMLTENTNDGSEVPATQRSASEEQAGALSTDRGTDSETSAERQEERAGTITGIPIKHLVFFSVGMAVAVDGLIAIHIIQKRREDQEDDDEEDYDEDE